MTHPSYQDEFSEQVMKKERRKLKARQNEGRSVWFGLGMFGLVGWSIAVPTLIGIGLGIWLDRTWRQQYSCTLMCLFVGLIVGCAIAWYWVQREGLAATDLDDDTVPEQLSETQKE